MEHLDRVMELLENLTEPWQRIIDNLENVLNTKISSVRNKLGAIKESTADQINQIITENKVPQSKVDEHRDKFLKIYESFNERLDCRLQEIVDTLSVKINELRTLYTDLAANLGERVQEVRNTPLISDFYQQSPSPHAKKFPFIEQSVRLHGKLVKLTNIHKKKNDIWGAINMRIKSARFDAKALFISQKIVSMFKSRVLDE